MTSKVQLDRDVISGICKHHLTQQRIDLSNFKLGLVSKKCFLALKTACDEECKAAVVCRSYCSPPFLISRDLDHHRGDKILVVFEPVFWLLKKLSLCELKFRNDNDQRYLQVLRKINGFGLNRISFDWPLNCDSNREFSDPDHRSELLRIISESSGALKELCQVPDIFLPHLTHTLKLEKLTTRLQSIPMNSNIKDFLQLSAKRVEIHANNCYLPSHLLENINAQTLHVLAERSWAEGIEESSIEIQANPTIQEISIALYEFYTSDIPDKIYDIKKIIENIQKGYSNLTLLKIQDIYQMRFFRVLSSKDFLQFFIKLFIKKEALLSELQDLSFSIQMEQVFESRFISKYRDCIKEISSLRKDKLKDFEEVKDDPRARTGHEYLSLKKSTQFGEGKSLKVTFYVANSYDA